MAKYNGITLARLKRGTTKRPKVGTFKTRKARNGVAIDAHHLAKLYPKWRKRIMNAKGDNARLSVIRDQAKIKFA